MRKLAILHFNPIEQYPPVLNWLNFLAGQEGEELAVRVYTRRPAKNFRPFTPAAGRIKIFRRGRSGRKGMAAYLNWLVYYLRTTLGLIGWRPDAVIYYETLSAFPALFYKRRINPNSSLFIHYHEYTSEKEYGQGMLLNRWLHRMEKKTYPLVSGISHTNADRIGLFKNDLAGIALPEVYALPNYPPAAWQRLRDKGSAGQPSTTFPIRIVYVGALSMDTMYTREFAEWVIGMSGKVIWDIYSDNITEGARAYLLSLDDKLVRYRQGVDYYSLPKVLTGYQVGVILYKGHIPNYVYNAPNKLFEYLSCGLDTWFPDVMKGMNPYISDGHFPKIMALDLSNLSRWDPVAAIDRSGLSYAPSTFNAEIVFTEWQKKIQNPKK